MERVPLSVRADHQDFEVLAGRIQESRYFQNIDISLPVSYTHLTLPTIYSV